MAVVSEAMAGVDAAGLALSVQERLGGAKSIQDVATVLEAAGGPRPTSVATFHAVVRCANLLRASAASMLWRGWWCAAWRRSSILRADGVFQMTPALLPHTRMAHMNPRLPVSSGQREGAPDLQGIAIPHLPRRRRVPNVLRGAPAPGGPGARLPVDHHPRRRCHPGRLPAGRPGERSQRTSAAVSGMPG